MRQTDASAIEIWRLAIAKPSGGPWRPASSRAASRSLGLRLDVLLLGAVARDVLVRPSRRARVGAVRLELGEALLDALGLVERPGVGGLRLVEHDLAPEPARLERADRRRDGEHDDHERHVARPALALVLVLGGDAVAWISRIELLDVVVGRCHRRGTLSPSARAIPRDRGRSAPTRGGLSGARRVLP